MDYAEKSWNRGSVVCFFIKLFVYRFYIMLLSGSVAIADTSVYFALAATYWGGHPLSRMFG